MGLTKQEKCDWSQWYSPNFDRIRNRACTDLPPSAAWSRINSSISSARPSRSSGCTHSFGMLPYTSSGAYPKTSAKAGLAYRKLPSALWRQMISLLFSTRSLKKSGCSTFKCLLICESVCGKEVWRWDTFSIGTVNEFTKVRAEAGFGIANEWLIEVIDDQYIRGAKRGPPYLYGLPMWNSALRAIYSAPPCSWRALPGSRNCRG